jgi:hypothetical protein
LIFDRTELTMTTGSTFLVFRDPFPSWVPGLTSREQLLWDEHAVFMDRLFEEGRVIRRSDRRPQIHPPAPSPVRAWRTKTAMR